MLKFFTTGIIGFILFEIFQIIVITVMWSLLWKYYLKDHLPQAWVDNYYMMGFGHAD